MDLVLRERVSWSTSMRMWGQEEGDDAYVLYSDESMRKVEEIAFRIDAGAVSTEMIRKICMFAKHQECVFITVDGEILAPDEGMLLAAIKDSTAKKYIDDPVSTLKSLDQTKIQQWVERLMRDVKPPPEE
jgi:hypothetical protein